MIVYRNEEIIEKYQKQVKKVIDFRDIDISFEDEFRYWLIKKKEFSFPKTLLELSFGIEKTQDHIIE